MTNLQRYHLKNGEIIEIEIEESQKRRGAGAVGTGVGKKLKQTTKSLKEALETLPSLADEIHAAIVEKQILASEIKVEFGFKFGADMGVIVAKSSAEANFKVNIKWKLDNKS